MVKKFTIGLREALRPIHAGVTKFGGQPYWLTEPQWLLSRATGEPMRFICQIVLTPDVFGDMKASMAYLFMTDPDESGEWVDGTYEPDGGENAIILQPGAPSAPYASLTQGPTLFRMIDVPVKKRRVRMALT